MKHVKTTALTAATLLTATAAQGAVVASWGSVQAINSNLDIVNPGAVIKAVDFTDEPITAITPVNVGGTTVNFDPNGVIGGSGFKVDSFFVDNNPAPGTVSGDFNSEFHSVLDGFRDNTTTRYDFTGLANGTYNLQVFYSDDRNFRTGSFDIVTNPGVLGEDIKASIAINGGEDEFGADVFNSGFVNATITLTGADTGFSLVREGGTGFPINAAVLTVVPEPGSLALIALGGLCVARRRRS